MGKPPTCPLPPPPPRSPFPLPPFTMVLHLSLLRILLRSLLPRLNILLWSLLLPLNAEGGNFIHQCIQQDLRPTACNNTLTQPPPYYTDPLPLTPKSWRLPNLFWQLLPLSLPLLP